MTDYLDFDYKSTFGDFHYIVQHEIPLIDVRAPIEYEKGAFKHTVNLPLMTDDERHKVGTCYKRKGHDAAVALGHQLVHGAVRAERIQAWVDFIKKHPNAMIYCFRGGLRSQLSQEWLEEALGRPVPRLEGGYKAFRTYLMDCLTPEFQSAKTIMVGGHTGSGKTILLKDFKNFVDLEAIANHRGSSFGNHMTPQPSQINYENNLAYNLIHHKDSGYQHILLENEDRNVGRCFTPKALMEHFNQGDLVILKEPMEKRIEITRQEYVNQALKEYTDVLGDGEGLNAWADYIRMSIQKLKRRLGGERLQLLLDMFNQALNHQQTSGQFEKHDQWIAYLLTEYYDPLYEYHMKRNEPRIVFTGSTEEVKEYLKQYAH